MAATLWIGLFVIMLVEVAANFEYKADVEKIFTEYQTLLNNQEVKFLKYEVINHNATVRLNRVKIRNTKGLYFFVDTCKTTSETSSKESRKGEVQCDGGPGIKAFLQNDKNSDRKRYRYSLIPKDPNQVFCLSEMRIQMFPMGKDEAFMRIMVIFKDIKTKQDIGIVINPFKPPITQSDKAHAAKNLVRMIPSPIPLDEFRKPNLQPVGDGNSFIAQSFHGNIGWMKQALQKAILAESLHSEVQKTYTEWYHVGPVLLPKGAYDNIVRLDPDLQDYFH